MPHITVRLTQNGHFELNTRAVGGYSYRVEIKDGEDSHPWQVTSSTDAENWKYLCSFESLDESLDYAVSLSTETYPAPGYGISLPCGKFMRRPANVKMEDVMAGLGWIFVTHIKGYSGKDFPAEAHSSEVRSYFDDLMEDTLVVVENVERCVVDEDDRTLWIASCIVPVSAFMRIDAIPEICRDIMEEEGIPALPDFEYFHRVNVKPHTADVIAFTPRSAKSDRSAA